MANKVTVLKKLLLVLLAAPYSVSAFGSKDTILERFDGVITFQKGYQFHGIDQSQGNAMLHVGLEYQISDNFKAGVWLGEYHLAWDLGKSKEVDYFIGYSKALSFYHTVHTSIWRYTYSDDYLANYNWTQWLIGYEYDGWLNLTLGLSGDYSFRSQKVSTSFAEVSMRQTFGPLTASLSLGRNDLSATDLGRFEYLRLKGVYSWNRWHLFADFTSTDSDARPFAAEFIHDGWGFGITYDF